MKKEQKKFSLDRKEILNNRTRVNIELDYNLAMFRYYTALDNMMDEYELYKGLKKVYNENKGSYEEADANIRESMKISLKRCVGYLKEKKKAELESERVNIKRKKYEFK